MLSRGLVVLIQANLPLMRERSPATHHHLMPQACSDRERVALVDTGGGE